MRPDGNGVDQDRFRRPDRHGKGMHGPRPELGEVPAGRKAGCCYVDCDRIEAEGKTVERRREALAGRLQISFFERPETVEGRWPFRGCPRGHEAGFSGSEIASGKFNRCRPAPGFRIDAESFRSDRPRRLQDPVYGSS